MSAGARNSVVRCDFDIIWGRGGGGHLEEARKVPLHRDNVAAEAAGLRAGLVSPAGGYPKLGGGAGRFVVALHQLSLQSYVAGPRLVPRMLGGLGLVLANGPAIIIGDVFVVSFVRAL